MKKKELRNFPQLSATPKMLRIAADDPPKQVSKFYHSVKYKYWLHLRCRVKNGILLVACFLTEPMRLGAVLPAYEIYIDKNADEYLTYDRKQEKWLTASVMRINWPSYSYYSDGIYISRETNKVLKRYFDSEQGGFKAIRDFQQKHLEDRLERRYRMETDCWDDDLKQTPALPKDWEHWVDKVAIPEQFMFYDYSRKKEQTGYCSHCEKWVPIKSPKYNKIGKCPRCRHTVTYKALGKFGRFFTKRYNVYLLSRCKDGIMIRQFEVYRSYVKNRAFEPYIQIFENRRVICNAEGVPDRAYYYGLYKRRNMRWIGTCVSDRYYSSYFGTVYQKSLVSLSRKALKQTALLEYTQKRKVSDPESYLAIWHRKPYLEKLVKAGLFKLAEEVMGGYEYYRRHLSVAPGETELIKLLKINKEEYRRLKKRNGGSDFLYWLQYEKIMNTPLPDDVIDWLCEHNADCEDFRFISEKMNLVQTVRYLQKQMRLHADRYRDLLTTWQDMLAMATGLGIDTDKEIIYKPRDLRKKHNELVALCHGDKEITVVLGNIKEKFPNVETILKENQGKYAYQDDRYLISEPTCIKDILMEARALQHCVDQERYFDRIARQESYILFLRKTAEPQKAYYTLEVEPGGSIRQKRTLYNDLNEDFKDAVPFLRKWQAVIAERLTEKDKKLAEESKVLRLREFEQLKQDKIVIHGGEKNGTLLADVLMQDLMEAA